MTAKEIHQTYLHYKNLGLVVTPVFADGLNIGLPVDKNSLIAFECSTDEAYQFFTQLKSYKTTVSLNTPQKKYVIYRGNSWTAELQDARWKNDEFQIDLKAGSTCILIPSSQAGKHTCTWSTKTGKLSSLREITVLTKEEFEAIISELREKLKEEPPPFLERLLKITSKYYQTGQKQELILGLSSLLKKAGFAEERIKEITKALCGEEAVPQEELSEIKSYSLLSNIMKEEDLRELISLIQKEAPDFRIGFTYGKKLYFIEEDSIMGRVWRCRRLEDKRVHDAAPYFWIRRKLKKEDNQFIGIEVRTDMQEITLPEQDFQKFDKLLVAKILSQKEAKIIWNALAVQAPSVDYYTRTGWIQKEGRQYFLHPLIPHPSAVVDLDRHQQLFVEKNKEEHHSFVFEVLREGRLLACKMVCAVAALFVEKLNSGFAVVDIGENGIGKTLTSILAVNLFYDAREPYSLYTTKTGAELMLSQFANLPVLLDEAALAYDDQFEFLVFLLSSGKGKARGTPALKVSQKDLASVLFITSEAAPKITRFGAFRRHLQIAPEKTADYTALFPLSKLWEKTSLIGCGTDYIRFLLEKGISYERKFNRTKIPKLAYIESIEKALILLEKFYQTSFDKTRRRLMKLFKEQHSRTERDILDVFMEEFSNFVCEKIENFVVKKDGLSQKAKSSSVYGLINFDTGLLYILTKKFHEFCQESPQKYDPNLILKKAKEKKKLICSEAKRLRTIAKIPFPTGSLAVSTYCFDFSKYIPQLEEPPF